MIDRVSLPVSRVLQVKSLEQLTNDIHFHKTLVENPGIRRQIYFDAAGVINMLLGMASIYKTSESGKALQWPHYYSASTLVYALAYRNWLGNIYTLPPHTDEFIRKIQDDRMLFRDYVASEVERLEKDFWDERQLKIHYLKDALSDRDHLKAWVAQLKGESVDLFKGVYLGSEKGYWKVRYKYLVKEKQILQFSDKSDYEYKLKDIAQGKLFNSLLSYLNEKRKKSSNNYIDTISLCHLNQKLQQFRAGADKSLALPVFFSDQELILEAVHHFSQQMIDGHYPFRYQEDFLIVRDANFFIIDGIYNAIRNKKGAEQDLEQFLATLEKVSHEAKLLADQPGDSKAPLSGSLTDGFPRALQEGFKHSSEEQVFLDFFENWWLEGGYNELIHVVGEAVLDSKRQAIDQHVHQYIEQERRKLAAQFSQYGGRIALIRKAWNQFNNLFESIKKGFKETGVNLDVFKELGARLSFPDRLCEEIQESIDRIFEAVQHDDRHELEAVEAEVVNSLVIGLFEQSHSEAEKSYHLDQLAKGLAILWIFEKYDLIVEVCDIVRQQCEADTSNTDSYPNPTFALLHAASIFLGRSHDNGKALEIIHCVEQKFVEQNYKVWISLSYLYYLLWNINPDGLKFPEISDNLNWVRELEGVENGDFVRRAIEYSQKALDWLEQHRNDESAKDKQQYRQRKYYYALNNYLFFKTIFADQGEFKQLFPLAESFENSSVNPDYWHPDRYSDTLARFFFRYAVLAVSNREFALYLKYAKRYNKLSIENSKRDKQIYHILGRLIEQAKIDGFARAVEMRARY